MGNSVNESNPNSNTLKGNYTYYDFGIIPPKENIDNVKENTNIDIENNNNLVKENDKNTEIENDENMKIENNINLEISNDNIKIDDKSENNNILEMNYVLKKDNYIEIKLEKENQNYGKSNYLELNFEKKFKFVTQQ